MLFFSFLDFQTLNQNIYCSSTLSFLCYLMPSWSWTEKKKDWTLII